MKILLLLVATASIARPLCAQSAETQRQLLAARDTIWYAWFNHDTALLERFLPPAAVSADGAGDIRWSDRRRIVEDSRGFVRSKNRLVEITFANTHIAQTGRSALVRSSYQTVVESAGRRDTSRGRATELFVQLGNTWVNPYWQLEPARSLSDAGREIAMPDTLGANFAIGDSAAMKARPTDYDALLGMWEFRFQNREKDGTFAPSFTGHWTFEKKPGGGLIEDRWRPNDPGTSMGLGLYTYRTFDHDWKVWHINGTWSEGGEVQPGLTWSDDTHRYAIQRSHDGLMRIRYLSLSANHFLWRADRSTDGGKTWLLDAGTMEATRIGK